MILIFYYADIGLRRAAIIIFFRFFLSPPFIAEHLMPIFHYFLLSLMITPLSLLR